MKRLLALWRNRHLQPKTALSRFPLVHRFDLKVGSKGWFWLSDRPIGECQRKICTTSSAATSSG
jgi:hypothetical protein